MLASCSTHRVTTAPEAGAASLASTIADAIPGLPAMRANAVAAAPFARTIDAHFEALFRGFAEVLENRRAA